ncbi:MAG: DUF1804 family protein, partial [[Pasteurella] mairii]|nr:DUF1804 family protein [[Pasteurella] mairii]
METWGLTMAHDEKTKAHVRRYYVFDRLTLEQAAKKAGVAFGTARRWKLQAQDKGDNWDNVRDAQIMAGGELEDISRSLLTGFILQYRATMNEVQQNSELNSKEKVALLATLSDSFTKMTAASKAQQSANNAKTAADKAQQTAEVKAPVANPIFTINKTYADMDTIPSGTLFCRINERTANQ